MTELNITRTPAQLFSKRLSHIKFSQLIIEDLIKIGRVNKKDLKEQYLLNSYIMNLVASWQVFIEELAKYAIHEIIKKNQSSNLNIVLKNNLDEKIKKFNTPNASNIDSLFKSIVGLEKITKCLDSIAERKQIDKILDIRHSIAHTGETKVILNISENFSRMKILMGAAEKIEDAVRTHIKK